MFKQIVMLSTFAMLVVAAVTAQGYPGQAIGYELIYPRPEALTLAKITSEPVLTTNTEATVQARTGLPQTASPMPTVALLGSAALVAGFGMLFWRRRTLPITRGQ